MTLEELDRARRAMRWYEFKQNIIMPLIAFAIVALLFWLADRSNERREEARRNGGNFQIEVFEGHGYHDYLVYRDSATFRKKTVNVEHSPNCRRCNEELREVQ